RASCSSVSRVSSPCRSSSGEAPRMPPGARGARLGRGRGRAAPAPLDPRRDDSASGLTRAAAVPKRASLGAKGEPELTRTTGPMEPTYATSSDDDATVDDRSGLGRAPDLERLRGREMAPLSEARRTSCRRVHEAEHDAGP